MYRSLCFPRQIPQGIFSSVYCRNVPRVYRFSRSLQTINDIVNPKIYHRIRVTANDKSINRAFRILMEILRQPALGHHMRHIECLKPVQATGEYEKGPYQRELGNNDLQLLQGAVERAGFKGDQRECIMNMLMQKTLKEVYIRQNCPGFYKSGPDQATFITQALTALLITVSPNLRSLALTPFFVSNSPEFVLAQHSQLPQHPLDQVIRLANENIHDVQYLRNLQRVYLICEATYSHSGFQDDEFYESLDFMGSLTAFHQLPRIESLSTDAMQEEYETDHMQHTIDPDCSRITRIAINHASVSTFYLSALIRSSIVLKEFEYSIGGRSTLDGGRHEWNPKTLILALLKHKNTLELLDLDADSYASYHVYPGFRNAHFDQHGGRNDIEEDDDENGSFWDINDFPKSFWDTSGSLSEFSSLKRLSVGLEFLFLFAQGVNNGVTKEGFKLVDCLPAKLEYLCIRGYKKGLNKEDDAQIEALKALKDSGLSSLKELAGVDEWIPNAVDSEHPQVPCSTWKIKRERWPEEDLKDDE